LPVAKAAFEVLDYVTFMQLLFCATICNGMKRVATNLVKFTVSQAITYLLTFPTFITVERTKLCEHCRSAE